MFEETSPFEIFSLIAGLSSKKSSGPNHISALILKSINYPVSYALSWIINKSFSGEIYTDCLTVANAIPLFKGGDASNSSNFKLISLLSQISKIFEKVLYKRLTSFFDKFEILTQQQYGFRNGYSTTLALADVHENLLQNIDESLVTCTILMDFSKAFDSVNHFIMIKNLEHHGVRGVPLKLLTSYLHNKKQYVLYDNITSSKQTISTGVPLESMLHPLLFLVYINDLQNASSLYIRLFADDTLVTSQKTILSLKILLMMN